ncbi:MAG: hypothetical protein JNM80_13375 [Phycisphaerae bacterium]|nr:hypothetical protein [Phycisphaerae bacterium]
MATGWRHTIALRSNGTVVCVGDEPFGCVGTPGTNETFVVIAAGYYHNLAITTEGRLRMWGTNFRGELVRPVSLPEEALVISVAAGEFISAAVKTDGTLIVWGDDPVTNCGDDPPCRRCDGGPMGEYPIGPPPPGVYVSVKSSGHFWIAQRNDGTLVGNGVDTRCQVSHIPEGTVKAYAAGHMHGVAITSSDEPPLLWGMNQYGQSQLTTDCPAFCPAPCQGQMSDPCIGTPTCWRPPPMLLPAIKEVEGAYYATIVKKVDNTLTGWGSNLFQESCPVSGEVGSFSCNYYHGAAVMIEWDSAGAYANCDGAGGLDFNDLACFNAKFAQGDPEANCDSQLTLPLLSASDVVCFIQKFSGGMP